MTQKLKSRLLVRWLAIAIAVAGLAQGPLFAAQGPPQAGPPPTEDPHIAEEQAAERQAGYLDQGKYADSYAYTGMLIRAQLDRDAYSTQIAKTRAGVGTLQSRALVDAGYTTTVSGAPEGQYVILHYQASFANRQDAVETVYLGFAKGYWRVDGYNIK
jgi:hypothetical protein